MIRPCTIREEANALTCFAFRNGFIEELHVGDYSPLLENPKLSRITDPEMKKLMIEASQRLSEMLTLKETDPEEYWRVIAHYRRYTWNWVKDETGPTKFKWFSPESLDPPIQHQHQDRPTT